MKQRYSYAECYKILKIKPDCSWEELRKAYKLQIQKWHPDRFEDGSAEKLAADEKIRHINASYQQLSDYHRLHGQLPVSKEDTASHKKPEGSHDSSHARRAPVKDQFTTRTATTGKTTSPKVSGKFRIIATLIAIAAFSYMLFNQSPTKEVASQDPDNPAPINNQKTDKMLSSKNKDVTGQEPEIIQQQADSSPAINISDNQNEQTSIIRDDGFFTYGSSIGKVISVQGPPSKIEGDIWYYGDSQVYFYEGEVVKWKRMPGYPLKAKLILTNPDEEKKKSDSKIGTNSFLD